MSRRLSGILIWMFLTSTMLVACVTTSPVDLAIAYQSSENYAEARKLLQPLAAQGDAVARHQLMVVHTYEVRNLLWGRPLNEPRAEVLGRFVWQSGEVVDSADPIVATNLALFYLYGFGVERDCSRAADLLKRAGTRDSNVAQERLGRLLINGNFDGKRAIGIVFRLNPDAIGMWGKKSLDDRFAEIAWVVPGSPAAVAGLQSGDIVVQLNGRELKDQSRIEWLERDIRFSPTTTKSVKIGYVRAGLTTPMEVVITPEWSWLRCANDQKGGFRLNAVEGEKWLRLAADKSNPDALALLGESYATGVGVKRDYAEAHRWYRMAADRGSPEAADGLAHLHRQGLGVPQDESEAGRWSRISSSLTIARQNKFEQDQASRIPDLLRPMRALWAMML